MSDDFFYTPTLTDLDSSLKVSKKVVTSRSSKYHKIQMDNPLNTEGNSFTLDCNKKFLDLLSTHFLICNDRIKGKGEDSGLEVYTSEAGIIGAFDGCGGLGAKTCPDLSNSTEAYLASRAVCGAVRQWFYSNSLTEYDWNVEYLKDLIIANLEICQNCSGESGPKLKGSMIRPFPSTIAIIIFRIVEKVLITENIWAGDSRTYILDKYGLAQLSSDDIKGEDAMSNITEDGALTNVVSVDKQFVLNRYKFVPKHPCIMFCATDGCFGYVSSPMEFEFIILDSLVNANNVAEWQQKLDDEIFKRSGDDQMIAIAAFGFENFEEMKKNYINRHNVLVQIMHEFEQGDRHKQEYLWEVYKPNYYRYIIDKEW